MLLQVAVSCPHCQGTFTPPRVRPNQIEKPIGPRTIACPKCQKPVHLLT
jgi:hypothetical protein